MNKKVILIFLILLLSLNILNVYGEIEEFSPADIVISLNSEIMELEEPPYIVNGRTLLPVRYIFEPLGLEVFWNGETRTAIGIKEGLRIELPIGSADAIVNGEIVKLDVPAVIINSRAYVPVRFVAESTGSVVGWNNSTRTVSINSDRGNYSELSIDELLVSIYYNSNNFVLNSEAIRDKYHEIVRKINNIEVQNNVNEVMFKEAVYELGSELEINVDLNKSLKAILENFNNEMTNYITETSSHLKSKYAVYEYDNGDKYFGEMSSGDLYGLGLYEFSTDNKLIGELVNSKRSGTGVNIYDIGYQYAIYLNDLVDGYQFSYYNYDESSSINLVRYKDGKREGKSFELRYDLNGKLLYNKFTDFENDKAVAFSEIDFVDGTTRYDRAGTSSNDIVLRIDGNGECFILPTDKNGNSIASRTGFGFKRFPDGVEYIGEFFKESRLAEGYYYASDDSSDIETNLMDQFANEIVESVINENQSEDEKIKALHDYLAEHILYDTNEDFRNLSHTAYGAIVDGVAVCDGYAEAFKYLLDKIGIESVVVFGEAVDDGSDFTYKENHAWNIVEQEDGYYHYDLTWNDDDLNRKIHYDYYKKNDTYFEDTHWWIIDNYSYFVSN